MFHVRDIYGELLAEPMTFSFLMGEVDELIEACRARKMHSIWEEWNDVWYCVWSWFFSYVPAIGFIPVVPGLGLSSVRKFQKRMDGWVHICEHHKVSFNKSHLFDGSNYRKKRKVARILSRHGVTSIDWGWIEATVGGWEGE